MPRMRDSVRANEQLVCRVPGCVEKRWGIATLCRPHRDRTSRQGHHSAPALSVEELNPSYARTKAVALWNANHPGMRHAVDKVEAWLASAERGESQYWYALRRALVGEDAADIIARAAAVEVYLNRNPRPPEVETLAEFERWREVQIGRFVLRTRPAARRRWKKRTDGKGHQLIQPERWFGGLPRHMARHLEKIIGPQIQNLAKATIESIVRDGERLSEFHLLPEGGVILLPKASK